MLPPPSFADLTWPLRTERLTLRPITEADADAALAYRSDPEVTRHLSHGVLDRAAVAARHADRVRRAQPGAPDPALGLAILDRDGRLLGDCLLRLEPQGPGWVGWIGYALRTDAHGRGYGTEAARALVGLAAGLGLPRAYAHVRSANATSRRVLEKAGFRVVQIVRDIGASGDHLTLMRPLGDAATDSAAV